MIWCWGNGNPGWRCSVIPAPDLFRGISNAIQFGFVTGLCLPFGFQAASASATDWTRIRAETHDFRRPTYANVNANGTIFLAGVTACENDYIRVWVTFPPSFRSSSRSLTSTLGQGKAPIELTYCSGLHGDGWDSLSESLLPGTVNWELEARILRLRRPFDSPVAVALRKVHCCSFFCRSAKLSLQFVSRRHQLFA